MMFIRIYRKSFLATLVSFIGSGLMYGGIAATVGGMPAGLLLAAVGFGVMVLAGTINDNKIFKIWKKTVQSKGIEENIKRDINLAVSVYKTHPCAASRNYILSLNPAAREYIPG